MKKQIFSELIGQIVQLRSDFILRLPNIMVKQAVGEALDKIGALHGVERKGMNDRRFRAALVRKIRGRTYSPELKTKNNFVRMWRYLFNPNACWACGSYEGHHIVLDTMEMGEGRIECEAEIRCGECGELHSQMSYSDWWPRIPLTLKGRIKYLQDELSYGPADVGVLCH